MKELSDTLPIRITLGRQEYDIKVKRQDEEIFRKAAKMINEKLGKYEQKFIGQSYEKYLSISLLDFAVHSIRLQQDKDVSYFMESIKELSDEIDDTLSNIK